MSIVKLKLACILFWVITGSAHASCAGVSTNLFGLSLGPRPNNLTAIKAGLEVEGLAEVVKDVGFDTLEGRIEGWEVLRIMAFYDRGNYVGITSILSNGKEERQQIAEAANLIGTVLGTKLGDNSEGQIFADCEDGISLTLQTMDWEGQIGVKVELKDVRAVGEMQAYVSAYCSDSSKIRPEDSCRR